MTNIWPSHFDEEPIPIVGILNLFVINSAAIGDKHSSTIENAPASSISIASFKSLKASSFV